MTRIKQDYLLKKVRCCISYTCFNLINTLGHMPVISFLSSFLDKDTIDHELRDHIDSFMSKPFSFSAGFYTPHDSIDVQCISPEAINSLFIDNSPMFPIEFIFKCIHDYVFENKVDLCGLADPLNNRDIKRTWIDITRMRINIAKQFIKTTYIPWKPDKTWHSFTSNDVDDITELLEVADARIKYHEACNDITVQDIHQATGLKEQTIKNMASRNDIQLFITKKHVDIKTSRTWFESRDEFKQPTIIDDYKPLALTALNMIYEYKNDTDYDANLDLETEYNLEMMEEMKMSLTEDNQQSNTYSEAIYQALNYLKRNKLENYAYLKWCTETIQGMNSFI